MKLKQLNLPEFLFVDGSEHESGGNPTAGRTLIFHSRTATVLEVFERGDVVLNEDVLAYQFTNKCIYGGSEKLIIAMHYSATLDMSEDKDYLMEHVLMPAAKWYGAYCDWEDQNIYNTEISKLN